MPGATAAALVAVVATSLLATRAVCAASDVGWDELYVTHNVSFPETCFPLESSTPSSLQGTFLLPSLGQFEMAGQSFQGLLDPYGKLSRFTFKGEKVCFRSRMMDTGFYNASQKMGKIAPTMLFEDTVPPTQYPGYRNVFGANDNVFVNTYEVAGIFRAVTDSQVVLEFDPTTLAMNGPKIKWQDKLKYGMGIGSAHGLPEISATLSSTDHTVETGCMVNVFPQAGMLGRKHTISVFRVCPDAPYTREQLGLVDSLEYMPYFHSFGLTGKHAVLPIMKFTLDFMIPMSGKPLSKAFVVQDQDVTNTTIFVVPLDGSAPLKVTIDTKDFFYVHTVNSYEDTDENGHARLVMDVIGYEANPFANEITTLPFFRNKTRRDNGPLRGVPSRLSIPLAGDSKQRATYVPLKGFAEGDIMGRTSTDFSRINPLFHGRKYCIFYAVQWRSNGHPGHPELDSFATMAIVKHNICTGSSQFWRGPSANFYPSEATFVPSGNAPSGREDDGVLVFTVLNGETRRSSIVLVNASDMKTLSNTTIPDVVGFTTHGEFYQHLH